MFGLYIIHASRHYKDPIEDTLLKSLGTIYRCDVREVSLDSPRGLLDPTP